MTHRMQDMVVRGNYCTLDNRAIVSMGQNVAINYRGEIKKNDATPVKVYSDQSSKEYLGLLPLYCLREHITEPADKPQR